MHSNNGERNAAVTDLQQARRRVDGVQPPPDDMVPGPDQATVLQLIDIFLDLFEDGVCP